MCSRCVTQHVAMLVLRQRTFRVQRLRASTGLPRLMDRLRSTAALEGPPEVEVEGRGRRSRLPVEVEVEVEVEVGH